MKDSTPLAIAISLVALAVFIFFCSQTQPRTFVPTVTPAVLDCDPDLWADQTVKVKLAGCERGENDHECIYRKFANKPPVVILHFKAVVPEKLPEIVVGVCRGRHGTAVVVEDCH